MKASSGIDLMVSLDRDSAVGAARAARAPAARSDPPGHAAPRGAAAVHARAGARAGGPRGVVMEAYAQLAAEGYLVSRQGAPTRVAARAAAQPARRRRHRGRRAAVRLPPRRARRRARSRRRWPRALRQGLRDAPDAALGYGDPRGEPELRARWPTYLGRVRGVAADPERRGDAGLTQGSRSSAGCWPRAACGGSRSRTRAAPTARRRRRRPGWSRCRSPVDARRARRRRARARRAGAVLLTPAHQYPTGAVLAPAPRAALLAWAARARRASDRGRLRRRVPLRPPPVGALQGLAPSASSTSARVSKTLAPALRIGWLVAPPALREPMRREKAADDRGTPVLDAARARRLARARRARPPPAPHAPRLPRAGATRSSRRSRALPRAARRGARRRAAPVADLPDGVDEAALVRAAAEPRRRARRPRPAPPVPGARG